MGQTMADDLQERIKKILNDHFEPLVKAEWKEGFSIYDIGARGQNVLDEVIVWVRSYHLQDHTSSLLAPGLDMMIIDPIDRAGTGDGGPRLKGNTVIVRLLKPINTEIDGPVDLLIELFQVFVDEDLAESCFDSMLSSTSRPSLIS
jgi:hypothetical protein